MRNLQYEIRICHKNHIKVAMSKVFICHISNVLDFGNKYRTIAGLIEDTCANPNSEKISSFSALMVDVVLPKTDETDRKVEDYAVTVCGWEISQDIYDTPYTTRYRPYTNIWINKENVAKIPYFQKVMQDMRENSKDWRCKYQIFLAKILKSTIFDLTSDAGYFVPSF